ncbi:MAG TPA: class I SAM-dependent methyltransferase, partial [Streptomyces sp.]|nr:class I SAM-dependent methyltransferase [Streptomyces sp.]
SNALAAAEAKARARGLAARFIRQDATTLVSLGESYDTALDCGLFHILTDEERVPYVDGLRRALPVGGRYFMLGLSAEDPGEWRGRMRKLTRADIESTFADGWRVDSIEPATIEITTDPNGLRAWRAALTRI